MLPRIAIVIGAALALVAGAVEEAAAQAPSRALLDRYCITCHNERLQTANLMLDAVDLERVGDHAEALEKVVRKLRAGQMPPEGRPGRAGPGRIAAVDPGRVRQRHRRPAGSAG